MQTRNLSDFITGTFENNKQLGKGKNNDGVFLVGFDSEQIERLAAAAVKAANNEKRGAILVDASNKSIKELIKDIFNQSLPFKSDNEAFEAFERQLSDGKEIIVISNISDSNISNKSGFIRSCLKIMDDGHFKGNEPRGDLVFIDTPAFLEKSWPQINAYIQTNIVLG